MLKPSDNFCAASSPTIITSALRRYNGFLANIRVVQVLAVIATIQNDLAGSLGVRVLKVVHTLISGGFYEIVPK